VQRDLQALSEIDEQLGGAAGRGMHEKSRRSHGNEHVQLVINWVVVVSNIFFLFSGRFPY